MIQVKIDGKIIYKGTPKDWANRPPDAFKDLIRPGYKPEPWMKSIMILMSDVVVGGGNLRIAVRTNPTGWTMEVKQ